MGLTTAQAIGIGVAVGFVGALILMMILLCISHCSSTETVPSSPVLLKRAESLPKVKQPSPNPWVLTAPCDPASWRNPITNSHRALPDRVRDSQPSIKSARASISRRISGFLPRMILSTAATGNSLLSHHPSLTKMNLSALQGSPPTAELGPRPSPTWLREALQSGASLRNSSSSACISAVPFKSPCSLQRFQAVINSCAESIRTHAVGQAKSP